MKVIGIILGVIVCVILILFIYCCLVLSSICEESEEKDNE